MICIRCHNIGSPDAQGIQAGYETSDGGFIHTACAMQMDNPPGEKLPPPINHQDLDAYNAMADRVREEYRRISDEQKDYPDESY